jgi:hypothetical protein
MAAAQPSAAAAGAPLTSSSPRAAPPRPVMLLLVGIPGSGKSTFSQALAARSKAPGAPVRWVAVNQVRAAEGARRRGRGGASVARGCHGPRQPAPAGGRGQLN